jgi:membrane associated rhomboid family serine protease
MNFTIIAVCLFVFACTYSPVEVRYGYRTFIEPLKPWADVFVLHSARPQLWQFITYAFLHSNIWHILGNICFLFIFGNKINDRLGNVAYLCFFICGAVVSGLIYSFYCDTDLLGASGAVAAVTGAYLVLYPESNISFFYAPAVPVRFKLPAFIFIILKILIFDLHVTGQYAGAHVANLAHIGGYGFGIIVSLIMLLSGILKGDGVDILYMLKQFKRRTEYSLAPRLRIESDKRKWRLSVVKQKTHTGTTLDEHVNGKVALIQQAIDNNDLNTAALEYKGLLKISPAEVLPRQQQLDLANCLMELGEAAVAARAYKLFRDKYSDYEYIGHIDLMLGVLLSRYLNKPENAAEYLQAALGNLHEQGQVEMCRLELSKIKKKL